MINNYSDMYNMACLEAYHVIRKMIIEIIIKKYSI